MPRFFNFMVAFGLILGLIPIYLLLSVLIWWELGKPVLFKQRRTGLYGRRFWLYKFRTMTTEKDEFGQLLSDNVRLNSVGILLRKYSLDELPQLWNVLKGEMALVGPRPLLPEYLPLYSGYQAQRMAVLPGITGWAQIKGRNALSWEDKFVLDIWYVENRNWVLDVQILLKTIVKVFKAKDVNAKNHATMEAFKGNRIEV